MTIFLLCSSIYDTEAENKFQLTYLCLGTHLSETQKIDFLGGSGP